MRANKPVTEVILKHKEYQQVEQFALTLEKIAQKLREEGQFTFRKGEELIQVIPSDDLKVSYEYTKKAGKHSFEIEFDWVEGAPKYSKMDIE